VSRPSSSGWFSSVKLSLLARFSRRVGDARGSSPARLALLDALSASPALERDAGHQVAAVRSRLTATAR